MASALVVFNPLAGRGADDQKLARIVEVLAEAGFEAEPTPTRGAGDATRCAREAAERGIETVFAFGGDGTFREAAAGLLGTDTALAFLPGGTVNVMALELGLPRNVLRAAERYEASQRRSIDVGLANGVPFLMQASAGIDARLIAELRPGEKRWLGRASSIPAILRSLAGYRFPALEVELEGGAARQRITLAVAANIARYGGPWKLCPKALADDGFLDLFLFTGRGRAAVIALALSLLCGRHLRSSSTEIVRTRRARVRSARPFPAQIDGDRLPLADHSLDVGLSPDRLTVLVPPA